MINKLQEFVKMSTYAGNRVDFTQGGGGNTSVKLDGEVMAIKASGFKLVEITQNNAYVPVDYKKIKHYYETVNAEGDHEKESVDVAMNNILKIEGMPNLRPSVEVGFHAILKKYVIHTHSIYAALIVCAMDGETMANEIFKDAKYNFVYLPYITPGFTLTIEMNKKIKNAKNYPNVVFMQNHGLVVHGDNLEEVIKINDDVNERIRNYFKLVKDELKSINLKKISENKFESNTEIVLNFLKENELSLEVLDALPLYPDQLVYLNNTLRLAFEKMQVENKKVYYYTNEKESNILEETLAAYLFVITKLKKFGKTISTMSVKDVDFINNWEVEKFRRSKA